MIHSVFLYFSQSENTFPVSNILDPPGIPNISSSVLFENRRHQIECSSSRGKPSQWYEWTLGERQLPNNQATLDFTPSFHDNMKKLKCSVINDYTIREQISLTTNIALNVECEYYRAY